MIYGLGTGALVGIVVGGIVVLFIIIIVCWYIATMNSLRVLDLKCEEALSGIDVQLTKRYDTLTKMIETTKGYMKHEKETLEDVIKMRNPNTCATMEDRNTCAKEMSAALSRLNVVMEQYPNLKADKSFDRLNVAIVDIEDNLQASRRIYNGNVTALNAKVVTFPSNIVANKKNIVKRDFFVAEEEKRKDVKIEF